MKPFENWFNEPGAYVLVDGQFGSTGKGLFAAYIALHSQGRINKVTTNAGPNSGHTAYWKQTSDTGAQYSFKGTDGLYDKIVTQQLPVASVFLDLMGHKVDTIINAGAIIDYSIMLEELGKWCNHPGSRVLIHPLAALINPEDVKVDRLITEQIAGTGKGTGPALANKLLRSTGKDRLASKVFAPFLPPEYASWDNLWDWNKDVVFVETAQGFSLGLNSARFYPHTTSRECTVQQVLSDARIPAQVLRKVVATFRTYPIRVGNTQESSGGWYPDQDETTWEALGLEPELTTITKRVRRVATWSWTQFRECVATNRPDVLFINFMNYLHSRNSYKETSKAADFLYRVRDEYEKIMGHKPEAIYVGYGPLCSDVFEADNLSPV